MARSTLHTKTLLSLENLGAQAERPHLYAAPREHPPDGAGPAVTALSNVASLCPSESPPCEAMRSLAARPSSTQAAGELVRHELVWEEEADHGCERPPIRLARRLLIAVRAPPRSSISTLGRRRRQRQLHDRRDREAARRGGDAREAGGAPYAQDRRGDQAGARL